jgi:mRNA-degrading endonuclease toxin of MazEF toxin-antitoxin module
MPVSVLPGQIWTADDSLLWLSEDMKDGDRDPHGERPVVIAISEELGGDHDFPFLLCVPITTKPTSGEVGRYEVKIAAGEESGLSKTSVAPVYLLQPISRSELGDLKGNLSDRGYKELLARLLGFLGQL